MINYTQILRTFYPDTIWTLNGDDYDGLTWLSDSPKPTKVELESKWDAVLENKKQAEAEAQAKRQALLDKLGITDEEARLLLGGN